MDFNFALTETTNNSLAVWMPFGIFVSSLIGALILIVTSVTKYGTDTVRGPATFFLGVIVLIIGGVIAWFTGEHYALQSEDTTANHQVIASTIQETYGLELDQQGITALTEGASTDQLEEGLPLNTIWRGNPGEYLLDGKAYTLQLAWVGDQWMLLDLDGNPDDTSLTELETIR